MPSKFAPKIAVTLAASICVLGAVAMPAAAGPRQGVQIVYKSDTPAARPAMVQATTQAAPVDKSKQRIEFRYPGQAPLSVSQTAPVVPFSPASTEVPQGPFEAQAAAARLSSPVREPVVEAASLQPVIVSKSDPKPIPKTASDFAETGVAIVYGDEFAGLPTANGEIFSQAELSAAHPTLPLPSYAKVTNPATGRQVVVRVNDRGPFEDGADFQVSRGAAAALGFGDAEQASLMFEYLGPAVLQPAAPKPQSQAPKPVVVQASAKAAPAVKNHVPEDELLGGDELAGGAGTKSAPAPVKRANVIWPEPPSDWDVAPKSAAKGNVYVQVASFSDMSNADALYRDLRASLPAEIVPARVNGTDYFRVRVGPFDDRSSAQKLRDRLDAEGKGNGRVVSAE
jgi:rare lipoprotein A